MATFTAFYEWDEESKSYIGTVPGLIGAHTQGETLEELQRNLKEVTELCLEDLGKTVEPVKIVGLMQFEAVA